MNASDLLPAGSIYGLEANKSVELTIPALALAGPVSAGLLLLCYIVYPFRLSIPSICTA
jgi:hypothetical protein